MKLIEGMKLKKELVSKAEDLRKKVAQHCVTLSIESPAYGSEDAQRKQISSWLQSHQDLIKKIRELAIAIQRTNLQTTVEIEIAGNPTRLSIAEWVMRRRELAKMEAAAWAALSDRGLKDQMVKRTDGQGLQSLTVVRYYDPVQRDKMVEAFNYEPGLVDRKLEVVNASTDLVGFEAA
jgi:hypothetical protein